MNKLVIKSSEWWRGGGGEFERTALKHPKEDKFCCLGLDLRARGIAPKDLEPFSTPEEYCRNNPKPKDYPWVDEENCDTNAAWAAMYVNDNTHISDDERIEELTAIFADRGIEIDWRLNE